jgi:hypothetical protein
MEKLEAYALHATLTCKTWPLQSCSMVPPPPPVTSSEYVVVGRIVGDNFGLHIHEQQLHVGDLFLPTTGCVKSAPIQ